MDRYEEGKAWVRVNDLPGSDLPRDLPDRVPRRVPVPRQTAYTPGPSRVTAKNYDFDKGRREQVMGSHGGVIWLLLLSYKEYKFLLRI